MKLIIKESSWSGWSSDYKPQEIEKEYEVRIGEKYIIKTVKSSFCSEGKMITEDRDVFSFEINEINDDNIVIHTFQPFSDSEDGFINLRSDKKDFTVSFDKVIKLVTPTKDCGDIFILSLIK